MARPDNILAIIANQTKDLHQRATLIAVTATLFGDKKLDAFLDCTTAGKLIVMGNFKPTKEDWCSAKSEITLATANNIDSAIVAYDEYLEKGEDFAKEKIAETILKMKIESLVG